MEKILGFYDNLFDGLPKTWEARKIKIQMQNNSMDQYEAIVKLGLSKKEAIKRTIASIPSIDEIAKYIPVRLFDTFFLKAILSLAIFIFCFVTTKEDHFLQIFYPVMFEYPLIIRNAILYASFTITMFYILKQGHKFLVSKKSNQSVVLQVTMKVVSLLLFTLYISSALLFCFFTFSGYPIEEILGDAFLKTLYFIYDSFICNTTMTLVYATITAVIYLFSEGNPHQSLTFLLHDKAAINQFQRTYIQDSILTVMKEKHLVSEKDFLDNTTTLDETEDLQQDIDVEDKEVEEVQEIDSEELKARETLQQLMQQVDLDEEELLEESTSVVIPIDEEIEDTTEESNQNAIDEISDKEELEIAMPMIEYETSDEATTDEELFVIQDGLVDGAPKNRTITEEEELFTMQDTIFDSFAKQKSSDEAENEMVSIVEESKSVQPTENRTKNKDQDNVDTTNIVEAFADTEDEVLDVVGNTQEEPIESTDEDEDEVVVFDVVDNTQEEPIESTEDEEEEVVLDVVENTQEESIDQNSANPIEDTEELETGDLPIEDTTKSKTTKTTSKKKSNLRKPHTNKNRNTKSSNNNKSKKTTR